LCLFFPKKKKKKGWAHNNVCRGFLGGGGEDGGRADLGHL